ncbi:alpha-galactosidase [Bifidobacterium canis]|uniref:alpha-galactosidase n=1 Tax=Bifidobacterium canis TaxID=2610880 RepID=A0A7K1J3J4_9BIFI|nr:alpha-galactosidase [Bifidobacterium canis]MUH59204.1 alpha-galactosidase [Bifidobacterium canis]
MTKVLEFENQAEHSDERLRVVYLEQAEARSAFALAFVGDELPRVVHWGRPVRNPETLINSVAALKPQRVSGALDETAWPSILPTQAESWSGETRFVVRRGGTELFCKFVVTSLLCDESGVTLTARDDEQHVEIEWTCEMRESGLIRQRAQVHNLATGELEVGKVELGFAVPADMTEILTTTGHHLHERSPQRQQLTIGRFQKASMVGRPDFDASLLLSVGRPGFGFTHGDVYSVHVGWSGNSLLAAEKLPYTSGQISGAEVLFGGEISLPLFVDGESDVSEESRDVYTTPWVYGAYGDGLNEVADRFHAELRNVHAQWRAERGISEKPRPVILNTWEAVYFQHDYDTLTELADKAVRSGVERFVVDDGWFGDRRDDTAGLGDWQISPDVWPEGSKSLKALADYVHGTGMEFGLWFEPEMVNPNSQMFREHPEWVLKPTPNRLPMQGRNQQVVDLTNPQAYDYVYGCMDSLIGELGIDYIKWDHNKYVTEAVSPLSGRPAIHEQTLAVYRIFRDLKNAHPGLEIESCSSGGGRVDMGILSLADRIWASDCVDPVERADIQRYTSLLVPPEMIGEHVGASPAHSTHRATSQELRMAMAFFGHLGIEWNLLKEPQKDLDELGVWVKAYKEHRDDFAHGVVVHGDDEDPAVRVDGVISADGARAVYRFTQLTTSQTYPAAPVRLAGLDPDATYHIAPLALNLESGEPFTEIGNGQSALGWWNADGIDMSGEALATYSLRPPSIHPANAVLFSVTRI